VGHVVRISRRTTQFPGKISASNKVRRTTVYVTIAARVKIATIISKVLCAQCAFAVRCSRPKSNLVYRETFPFYAAAFAHGSSQPEV
jgi:hypothetical protein